MWQKIKCWLGFHHWIRVKETVYLGELGECEVWRTKCKYCGNTAFAKKGTIR